MKYYKNLKISSKLIVGFVIVALLSGVVGIVAIINTNNIIDRGNQLYQQNLIPLKPVAKIQNDFLKIRINLRDMALAKTTEAKAKYSNNIDSLYKDLQDNIQSYSKNISSSEEAANLITMQKSITEYDGYKVKIIAKE